MLKYGDDWTVCSSQVESRLVGLRLMLIWPKCAGFYTHRTRASFCQFLVGFLVIFGNLNCPQCDGSSPA